jgi:hypothetical protein
MRRSVSPGTNRNDRDKLDCNALVPKGGRVLSPVSRRCALRHPVRDELSFAPPTKKAHPKALPRFAQR